MAKDQKQQAKDDLDAAMALLDLRAMEMWWDQDAMETCGKKMEQCGKTMEKYGKLDMDWNGWKTC